MTVESNEGTAKSSAMETGKVTKRWFAIFYYLFSFLRRLHRFASNVYITSRLRTRHLVQSCRHCSSCLGAIPMWTMLALIQSLKRLNCLACFSFSLRKLKWRSWFRILSLFIRLTWPVHRSWAFKIMASRT